MRRKKIAFLISALDEGGMGRVLEMLSLGLPSEEYEQYIILLIKGRKNNFKYAGKLLCVGGESANIIGKCYMFIKRIIVLSKLKRKHNFDIVLSFGADKNFLNEITRYHEKVIMSQHNVASIEHKSWGWYGKLNDWFVKSYDKCDALISVSKFVTTDLHDTYKINNKHMMTIYNGVDLDAIWKRAKEETDLKFMNDKVNLICVSRLVESKGIWHAMKIVSILKMKIPNIQLTIIGDGELSGFLRSLATKLGIGNNCIFLGAKENPFPYVANSDLFLFPSIYEGFGMAFVEAMALGIPVVAADCKAGPREVLAGNSNYNEKITDVFEAEYGVLVPSLQPFDKFSVSEIEIEEVFFAKAVLDLLLNKGKHKRYRAKAMERSRYFSQKRMVSEYRNVFESVL